MIRLHKTDDHGWFVETNRPDHNHPLADNCGEKCNGTRTKGLTSTQRVESANDMLKTYIPRNSSMNKFVPSTTNFLKIGMKLKIQKNTKTSSAIGKREVWLTDREACPLYLHMGSDEPFQS